MHYYKHIICDIIATTSCKPIYRVFNKNIFVELNKVRNEVNHQANVEVTTNPKFKYHLPSHFVALSNVTENLLANEN